MSIPEIKRERDAAAVAKRAAGICRSSDACGRKAGHGETKAFCKVHAAELQAIRNRWSGIKADAGDDDDAEAA